jgi:uncharacterized protein with FMN-binding domain
LTPQKTPEAQRTKRGIAVLEKQVKKRILFIALGITAFALLSVLGGCPVEDTEKTPPYTAEPFPGNPSGKESGRANGYHGYVDVEITMENGWITEAKVEGPGESPGVGAVAIEQAPEEIKKRNSVEIDTLAEASITTKAIKAAGKEAIEKILAAAGS